MKAELFCLHGFLGGAADWSADLVFPGRDADIAVHAVDWLSRFGLEAPTWTSLAARVNDWALSQDVARPRSGAGTGPARQLSVPRILGGYSLGGRVAMHALLAAQQQWDGAVIVAANPGLPAGDQRARRLAHDREWAQRFRQDAWPRVLSDWNAQPVFAGESFPAEREESAEARECAAAALERWSVGGQSDLRDALRQSVRPVLWVAGERDTKYAALMRECAGLNQRFGHAEIPGAGHRAQWTAAAYFESVVREWIDTLAPAHATTAVHEDVQTT